MPGFFIRESRNMNERHRVRPVQLYRSPQENDSVAATHNHTRKSDSFMSPNNLVYMAHEAGINTLIVTDHDRTGGAAEALTIAENCGLINITNNRDHFEVIFGQEVTTTEGHLLIWGGSTTIVCGLSAQETAEVAHDQGAIVTVPHPGFEQGEGVSWEMLDQLLEKGLVDAVEARNGAGETLTYMSRILAAFVGENIAGKIASGSDSNLDALRHARRSGGIAYAITGGQDAHLDSLPSLTKVVTLYPQGMSFLDAVRERKTVYSTKNEPEFWGPRMYLRQRKLSKRLEDDRQHNRDGIMCVTGYE